MTLRSKLTNFLLAVLVLLALGLSGCIKVVSADPANGATDISRTSVITVTFNISPNDATVNSTTFFMKDGQNNLIDGTITCRGTQITFIPKNILATQMSYTATVTSGIKDKLGFPMLNHYSFQFTTNATQENYVLTINQNKIFTECNYHSAWIEQDPDNPNPLPDQKEAYSNGNTAHVFLSATPDHAGVAEAFVGVKFEWNLGQYIWEVAQNIPVIITIDFSYEICAEWTDRTGSSNAGFGLHSVVEPWYDFIGHAVGSSGIRTKALKQTFTTTMDGRPLTVGELDRWGRGILAQANSQAHSVPNSGVTNYSYADITINSIEIDFGPNP
jgi:hypothetical protein